MLSKSLWIGSAASLCAVALAACGSSSKPSASASTSYSHGVKYADCMRSHGIPDFPDPVSSGGFPTLPSTINQQSPSFLSAEQACAKLQPGAGGPKPAITGAQQAEMVANARCIRNHGVPNFPDPTFGPGGQGVNVTLPGELNRNSPAVLSAAKACAHTGTPIPGIGVG